MGWKNRQVKGYLHVEFLGDESIRSNSEGSKMYITPTYFMSDYYRCGWLQIKTKRVISLKTISGSKNRLGNDGVTTKCGIPVA